MPKVLGRAFALISGALLCAALAVASPPAERPRYATVSFADYKPYCFVDASGAPAGFVVDLTHAVAARAGFEALISVATLAEAKEALASGRISFLSIMAYTPEREELYDFSHPYAIAGDAIFSRKGGPRPQSLSELGGLRVVANRNDIAYEYITSRGYVSPGAVLLKPTIREVLQALEAGEADAAVLPKEVAIEKAMALGLTRVVPSEALIEEYNRTFSFAVRDGDHEMLARLNEGLALTKTSGEYDALYAKWFSAYRPKTPFSETSEARWLLLALLAGVVVVLLLYYFNRRLEREVSRQTAEAVAANEARAREGIERIRLAQVAGGAGTWWWNVKTGEVYWSEELWSLYGLDPESDAPSYRSWLKAAHPDYRDFVRLAFLRALRNRTEVSIEWRVETRGGEERWQLTQGRVETDEAGEAARVSGLSVDITRRKLAELEVARQKEQARKFLEIAGVIIIALDREGKVLVANRKACETLGRSEEEVVGRDWFALAVPENEWERLKTAFSELMAGNDESWGYVENHIVTASGALRLVAWRNTLLRDERGMVVASLSSGEDVTEKRELELQLQQAQKMEALGTLAGGIAHDFNNILGAILGYTELSLPLAQPESELHENLTEIAIAGGRARDLVRQILAFSRKSREATVPVDLALIAKEAVKLLRSTVPTTISITLTTQKPPPPAVLATPTQLHQVLMNLGTNAYHALKAIGGQVRISIAEVVVDAREAERLLVKPGRFVCLTVADDGPGIAPEVLGKIFEPFFTTKAKGEGTGLGLSAVHSIARATGGAVTVESAPYRGASFSVFFPACAEAAKEEAGAAEGSDVDIVASVLVVDDEEPLAKLIAKMLARQGIRTRHYTRATDALAELEANPTAWDAVVTDQTMPTMTGSEFLRRAREAGLTLPFIVCTGFSDVVDPEEAARLGFFAYLRKPVNQQVLLATLNRALNVS